MHDEVLPDLLLAPLFWHVWMCMFMYLQLFLFPWFHSHLSSPNSESSWWSHRVTLVLQTHTPIPRLLQIHHVSRLSPWNPHPHSLDSLCSVYCSIWMKNSLGSECVCVCTCMCVCGVGGREGGARQRHNKCTHSPSDTLCSLSSFSFAISLTCSLSVSLGGRTHTHAHTSTRPREHTHTRTHTYAWK